jgi:hypothetical protein
MHTQNIIKIELQGYTGVTCDTPPFSPDNGGSTNGGAVAAGAFVVVISTWLSD